MKKSLLKLLAIAPLILSIQPLSAQTPPILPREQTPSTQPLEDPDSLIRKVPNTPSETPLQTNPELPTPNLVPNPATFKVRRFKLEGSTLFSQADLDRITQPFINKDITFAEVLQVRSAITQLYADRGYITTGAYVPEQEFVEGGEVTIRVIEGSLEEIRVEGTRRLNPDYIRSRIGLVSTPLNQQRLIEALQLLRLNPLIANLSAELSTMARPGKSLLTIAVQEAPTFHGQLGLNNGRSPSVGSDRRGLQLSEDNLLGIGDRIGFAYNNTTGSNALDVGYTLPISPHNATLSFDYGTSKSNIIEQPFDILGIESKSRYSELTLRHPLHQSTRSEFAIGLVFSHRENETALSLNDIGGFPLSPGADDQGRTRLSAIRFFQEWIDRSQNQVVAVRSQFSIGLDAFNATINSSAPDSRFFAWRGQAQWLRLLGSDPDSLLLLRADVQLVDRALLTLEQFGLGGLDSVRGYRQDALLTDSGIFASAEVRLPILRIPNWQSIVSLTPFLEVGQGWNHDRPNPDPDVLLSGGLGLRWRMGDRFVARFDWGIPFISTGSSKRTLQEKGLYFSVLWNPF